MHMYIDLKPIRVRGSVEIETSSQGSASKSPRGVGIAKIWHFYGEDHDKL